jgi:hypothetical protein
MKATKTIAVALFLLLFPVAAYPLIPPKPPSSRGCFVYDVYIGLNGQTKNGLMASADSIKFRQYFTENVSVFAKSPEVDETEIDWRSIETDLNANGTHDPDGVEWNADVIVSFYCSMYNVTFEHRLGEFLSQWYTERMGYIIMVGAFYPGSFVWFAVAALSWFALGVFLAIMWWRKTQQTKVKKNTFGG